MTKETKAHTTTKETQRTRRLIQINWQETYRWLHKERRQPLETLNAEYFIQRWQNPQRWNNHSETRLIIESLDSSWIITTAVLSHYVLVLLKHLNAWLVVLPLEFQIDIALQMKNLITCIKMNSTLRRNSSKKRVESSEKLMKLCKVLLFAIAEITR